MITKQLRKSKKGGMLLRDVMFSVLVFGMIIALLGIVVNDFGTDYSNENMTSQYVGVINPGGQNDSDIYNKVYGDVKEMEEAFKDDPSVFGFIVNIAAGIGGFLLTMLQLPLFIGTYVESWGNAIGIPMIVATPLKILVIVALYTLILFGIGTAVSRGSKM
jgi:hypothetical protein|tara:strand:- start:112 stop:594 length:483 start_codon:yes stop_codon:yes gene_type:complete